MGAEGYKPSPEEMADAESRMKDWQKKESKWREDAAQGEIDEETRGILNQENTKLEFFTDDPTLSYHIKGRIKGREVDIWDSIDPKNAFGGTIDGKPISDVSEAERLFRKYKRAAILSSLDSEQKKVVREEEAQSFDL